MHVHTLPALHEGFYNTKDVCAVSDSTGMAFTLQSPFNRLFDLLSRAILLVSSSQRLVWLEITYVDQAHCRRAWVDAIIGDDMRCVESNHKGLVASVFGGEGFRTLDHFSSQIGQETVVGGAEYRVLEDEFGVGSLIALCVLLDCFHIFSSVVCISE